MIAHSAVRLDCTLINVVVGQTVRVSVWPHLVSFPGLCMAGRLSNTVQPIRERESMESVGNRLRPPHNTLLALSSTVDPSA